MSGMVGPALGVGFAVLIFGRMFVGRWLMRERAVRRDGAQPIPAYADCLQGN